MSEKSFYYVHTTPEGLIHCVQETPSRMEVDLVFEVDSFDPSLVGRYRIDGEIGPAPKEDHYWQWDESLGKFVETPFPPLQQNE